VRRFIVPMHFAQSKRRIITSSIGASKGKSGSSMLPIFSVFFAKLQNV
jgi:hypothetical protein